MEYETNNMRQPNLQIIQEYIIKILIKRYKIIDVGKELYDLGYSEYTS
ncbi:hypothetical protein FACS189459_5940 [Bacilli bacterium]|nr:hypothetical protein FACS189459_5940 [Bacilli bacterium]